jgi:WD40 repeat protein
VAFDSWPQGHVLPTIGEAAVIAPNSTIKLEAVSSRLKGELIHPNRTSVLEGIRFSADGKRLIAGDYPGGVVVVWDVVSGRQLTTIETGYGYRGSLDYFFLTPDWRTLLVARMGKRKYERLEEQGKPKIRWTFNGDVRAWDLASGQVVRTYQHQPPRGMRLGMELSPDGTTFVTFEELPGTYEQQPKRAASLWDAKTGEHRPLPDGLASYGRFSPDGRSLAIASEDSDGYAQAIKLIDVATGHEKRSIAITQKYAWAGISAFSPDCRLMVGNVQRFEGLRKWDKSQSSFRWWDAATGREVASFAADQNTAFTWPRFSPDGTLLAVTDWQGEKAKLVLFRVPERKLTRTIVLGEKGKGERLITMAPVFRPDGKQVAVISQAIPDSAGREPEAHDVPQARIFLIDVASGAVQERLVAPQGFPRSACYSPDGRTLATGGEGRVLLWDVANGATASARAGR